MAQQFDVEYLRQDIRQCLSCEPAISPSALGDMHTSNPKEPLKLKRTQGRHVVHATNTRSKKPANAVPAGIDQNIMQRKMRALWQLQSSHICSILARYGSDSQMANSSVRLAGSVSKRYASGKVRNRARQTALAILAGGDVDDIRKYLEFSKEDWRASNARRTYYEVAQILEDLDVDSLRAWESAWWKRK